MESCKKSEEGDGFSDARDDFSSLGCESECGSTCNSRSSCDENDIISKSLNYDFWAKEPIISIEERRDEFLKRTGIVLERYESAREDASHDVGNEDATEEEEEETKAIITIKGEEINKEEEDDEEEEEEEEEEAKDIITLKGEEIDKEDSPSMTPKLYGKCVSNVGELIKPGGHAHSRTSSSSSCHEENSGLSNWVHHHFRRSRELIDFDNQDNLRNKERKEGWLKRLSFKGSSSSTPKEKRNEGLDSLGNPGVHVSPHKKQCKELSSLYLGQDFDAQTGSIQAMKFSPDGRRLATGGQDGSLRIWEVVQDSRSAELDVLGFDQANVDSFNKRDDGMMRKLKKPPERACIIAPKKLFRIVETPLHESRDHQGAVLDLSWSEKGLLSSSVDKTVRLWQPGEDHCVRVFCHHNFVTCVQFNPVDDNFFISGSIDGKVRIWSILHCQVIHWIDIKEIVSAICYCPDGKGAIAGTISGICHFYDIKDNQLHSNSSPVCLEGKRSPNRRINSFQFSPSDSNKVIIASGDSQVRVLSGRATVGKLRGPQSGRMNMSAASFTVEGKYVVSASADSNVCIWDCCPSTIGATNFCNRTNDIRSCESFVSENAMIAVPWHGYRGASNKLRHQCTVKELEGLSSRLSAMVLDSVGEVNAKPYKDVCEKMNLSDMWGVVIVTGGSDGRIRTYHNYGLPVRT